MILGIWAIMAVACSSKLFPGVCLVLIEFPDQVVIFWVKKVTGFLMLFRTPAESHLPEQ